MNDFSIVTDKTLVDVELLLQNEPSLPEAMRQLNLSEAFVAVRGERTAGVCLLSKRRGCYDITNLAVDPAPQYEGVDKELLFYALDYIRIQGERFVEIGAGNADLDRHELLTRLGFRVVGVWSDHFMREGRMAVMLCGVLNQDLLRYRLDIKDYQRGE
jgi:GNAT superfamily N-acetyltransferase